MQLTDKPKVSDDVVAREVAGETVLLNLTSGTYFGLDAVGGEIWQWLDEGECSSLADICDRLTSEYDVSRAQAEADLLALADDLAKHGLLTTASA